MLFRSQQENFIKRNVSAAVVWALPSSVYDSYKMTRFVACVATIGVTTVIYKSAVKFVLFCSQADIGDVVEAGAARIKRFYF